MEEDIKARDYKEFLDMLESSDYTANDVYQEIMKKEQAALDTMNNIAKERQKTNHFNTSLTKMSVSDHYFRLVKVMRDIFTECMVIKDPRDLPWIFLGDERKIYVGALLVFVALVIFFITISS
jgi:hypothetical protein